MARVGRLPIFISTRERKVPTRGQSLLMTAGYGLAGALLMYLFDPDRGRRRRKMARDRLRGRLRRVGRVMGQLWRGAAADAYGVSHRIVHLVPKPTEVADDETLRQRVESQLFRDRSVPKGDLSLTAEHGTIIVRGVLDNPLDVTRLEQRIRSVPGVRGVQNLLHPHGTPAPNKERSVNTPKELTTDR